MFKYVTGDILDSSADCLVNTVNCEGYMGKGIAYQFKLRFPENNRDYVDACKSGRLRIGTIHTFKEASKIIINFPTKNKWREKSRIEYIHSGMKEVLRTIPELGIKSIAIPPLGCGNGGLQWAEVKPIIVEYLKLFSDTLEIFIYEPGQYYKPKSIAEPKKLTTAHLILMLFKSKLKKFNKLRLQKSAYFLNFYLGDNYFKFEQHKFGPYSHSIDIIIKDIKEFQDFYKIETADAFHLAKARLISESVEKKLKLFDQYIEATSNLVNMVSTDKELELLATICSVIEESNGLNEEEIVKGIKNWSIEKSKKFSDIEIKNSIQFLLNKNILTENLIGFYILTEPSYRANARNLVSTTP